MTITQLQYFVSAYQLKKISLAAEQNFVSRPAVSRALSDLGKEFNITLFLSGPYGIEPTAEAQKLYELALPLVQHFDAVSRDIPFKISNKALRIAFGANLGSATAIPFISGFREEYPNIEVEYIEQSRYLINVINEGMADFAFAPLSILTKDIIEQYRAIKIWQKKLTFCCSTDSPLTKKTSVYIKDIAASPFFIWKEDNETLAWINSIVDICGFVPQVAGIFEQFSTILSLVRRNLGISFITPELTHHVEGLANIALVDDVTYDMYLIWKKNLVLDKHKKSFIEFAKRKEIGFS